MTSAEVVKEVTKDYPFYKNSGGGITFSGGEPLRQPEFLQKMMATLKRDDFHITLDTTGYASSAILESILPLVDLVLLDIKHLDPNQHVRLTGVDNRTILKNASIISRRVQTWFRVPLIAGVNDDVDHVSRVVSLAKNLGVERISFLPYHEGGISKWSQLGKKRPVFEAGAPNEEHLEVLKDLVCSDGIQVGIRS